MTVRLVIDNVSIPVKHIRFSDGGSNVKLEIPEGFKPSAYFSISVDTTTPVDNYLWEILSTLNAIENTFGKVFNRSWLHLPYLPHGRADRIFEVGNAFPLKLFLDIVEPLFAKISLTDPHSDFALDNYPDKFDVRTQSDCFLEVVKGVESGDVLVAPDKGAMSKIFKLQSKLDYRMISTYVIEASKKRDITTGKIISTELPTNIDLTGKVVYIVDDLADGAGTFIPLAEKLKEHGVKEVHLYVTHGIFSKGLEILKGKIDKIHCYQTIGNFVNLQNIEKFNLGD